LRIVSGSARGTKLVCPEGLSVRPTHDRVKEALFSMLNTKPVGAHVLDLFAGSGALGLEALSRGAEHAVFVDVAASSLSAARANAEKAHLSNRASFFQTDYVHFLENTEDRFDIIFMDPPYFEGFLLPALQIIAERKLLREDGLIYCETDASWNTPFSAPFSVIRDKKYGRARVLLLSEMSL